MSKEIRVPTLGESVTEATVAAWLKNRGDAVAADEIVCELETDKVNVEVPAPVAGVLGEILAPVGTRVEVGALIATVTAGTAPAKASKTDKPVAEPVSEPKSVSKPSVRNPEHAPSAKRLLSEAGLSPDQVDGTGRDGRIMKADVLRAIESLESPPTISVSPAIPADGEERVRMTGLRQTIARRLKEAQNTAAMLTTYNEVDMARVIELRRDYKDVFERKHGVKLGFMPFFVKACCSALLEVPEINAEIDGTEIIYKRYVHMGIAVGTPTGLVVPVLRDAHSLGFAEIEKGIAELGTRARGGKLSVADMQGGTFSISNGGVYGSLMSSPILNPPQSGILGMHAIQDRPVARDGEIVIRPMMYLALSYDHRIVDGKGAVTFLVRVRDLIQDPRRLLMEV